MALRYGVYISEKISSCVIDVGVFLHQAVLLAALPNRPAKCGKLSIYHISVCLSVCFSVRDCIAQLERASFCVSLWVSVSLTLLSSLRVYNIVSLDIVCLSLSLCLFMYASPSSV